MEAREEDWVTQLFVASTHAYVFFFSDKGKVYVKKVYEIPLARAHEQGARDRELHRDGAGREGRGHRRGARRSRRASSSSRSRSKGQIKKTELDEYENFREKGIIGVKVDDGDQLLYAALTDGTREHAHRDQERPEHPLPRGAGAPDGPRDASA